MQRICIKYLWHSFIVLISFLLLSEVHINDLQGQVLEQDSLALMALYDSTAGANWTDNAGWSTRDTSDVATWYGVTESGGRVTTVYLYDNNLSGKIPARLGDLTALTDLDLGANALTDTIPSALGNLSNLQKLYLDENT